MIKTKNCIQFHFLSTVTLSHRNFLKGYIQSLFSREKISLASLRIIFCSDQELLQLNRQFLQHDYYTDILSFPLSEPGEPLTAEIYISTERVKENAKNLNTTLQTELHRVIFHGALHFCGYKDKTQAEMTKMRLMEDMLLKRYFNSLR
jgi:probable rRNA maturation factor